MSSMVNHNASRFLVIIIATVAFANCLVAQDSVPGTVGLSNQTGDVPYSAQIGSQFEHVELSNGNLIVEIPFLNLPGRGMSFNYGIRYDAAYWLIQNQNGCKPAYWNPEMRNWLTQSTLGWTSTQPYMTYFSGQMTCISVGNQVQIPPSTNGTADPVGINTPTGLDEIGGPGSSSAASNPSLVPQGEQVVATIFTDEHGTKHQIPNNIESNGDCMGGSYNFSNLQGPSIDQQGYWGGGWGAIYSPDGAEYTAGGTSGGITSGQLGALNGTIFVDMAKVTDTRGNTQIVSPGNIDTVGRAPITQQTSTNQIVYTVMDSNGNPQHYTVNLESIALNTDFNETFQQVADRSFCKSLSVVSTLGIAGPVVTV